MVFSIFQFIFGLLARVVAYFFPQAVSPAAAPMLFTPRDDLVLHMEVVWDPVSALIEAHLTTTALSVDDSLENTSLI